MKVFDSGVGLVTEHEPDKQSASILREVQNPKTYSTLGHANRHGQCKDSAPITMLDGSKRWIPLNFWHSSGLIYIYKEVRK
jgi:hypothetical protein